MFVNGVRCGTGEYRSGSTVYSGDWADDEAHGKVTFLFCCCFVCLTLCRKKKGKLVAGQATFVGQFDHGAFVSGTYTAPDGTVFTGASFSCSTMLEGLGTAKYPDKSLYSGAFKRGVPEGDGRVEYADGSVLTGVFKGGKVSEWTTRKGKES